MALQPLTRLAEFETAMTEALDQLRGNLRDDHPEDVAIFEAGIALFGAGRDLIRMRESPYSRAAVDFEQWAGGPHSRAQRWLFFRNRRLDRASHSVLLRQTLRNESCCPLVTDLLSGLHVVCKSCDSSTLSFGRTGCAPDARSNLICLWNSGLAKTGEICGLDQGADLRHPPRVDGP